MPDRRRANPLSRGISEVASTWSSSADSDVAVGGRLSIRVLQRFVSHAAMIPELPRPQFELTDDGECWSPT